MCPVNFASVGFTYTNANKAASGDLGRLPVAVGQAAAVTKSVAQMQNPVSKLLNMALETANTDPVAHGLGKIATVASKYVNPLIVASSGFKVLTAPKEERKKTFFTEGGCLAGMFIGEGYMKRGHLDNAIAKLPINAKWKPLVRGLVFIAGSITASTIGQTIGSAIANWNATSKPKQVSQENPQKVYVPMSLKA